MKANNEGGRRVRSCCLLVPQLDLLLLRFHIWKGFAARFAEFLEHPSEHATASASAVDENVPLQKFTPRAVHVAAYASFNATVI